jgi:hypothetical protein
MGWGCWQLLTLVRRVRARVNLRSRVVNRLASMLVEPHAYCRAHRIYLEEAFRMEARTLVVRSRR